jgi:hypothetical protein
MKYVIKAILLSALVSLGVGQLVFQSYRRAIALILILSITAYVYIEKVVSKYQPLIDRVKSVKLG